MVAVQIDQMISNSFHFVLIDKSYEVEDELHTLYLENILRYIKIIVD